MVTSPVIKISFRRRHLPDCCQGIPPGIAVHVDGGPQKQNERAYFRFYCDYKKTFRYSTFSTTTYAAIAYFGTL
jgi:hypothetical protein